MTQFRLTVIVLKSSWPPVELEILHVPCRNISTMLFLIKPQYSSQHLNVGLMWVLNGLKNGPIWDYAQLGPVLMAHVSLKQDYTAASCVSTSIC